MSKPATISGETIGERIKAFRLVRGMTQKELGTRMGVDQSTVRKYESGKLNPKIETVKKIADALGVDAWTLVDPAVARESAAVELPAGLPDETRAELEQMAQERAQVLAFAKLDGEREQKLLDRIVKDFQYLNDAGQVTAAERVHELTEIKRYQNRAAFAFDQFKAEHTAPDAAGDAPDDTDTEK